MFMIRYVYAASMKRLALLILLADNLERHKSTQTVLTRVPEPTRDEMESMVAKSHAAWLSWREVSVLKRQKIMLKSVQLLLFLFRFTIICI